MANKNKIPGRLIILILVGFVLVTQWGGLPAQLGGVGMDTPTANTVMGLINSDGLGVSGQIYRASPMCYIQSRVVSCSVNKSVDGVILLADIANPGSTDFYGTLEKVSITPVDKNSDATELQYAITNQRALDHRFILNTGKETRISTNGVYPGSRIDNLIPAGGQGLWASVVDFSRVHPHGSFVYSYTVCANGISGGKQCVDQEPLEITISDDLKVTIKPWGGTY